MESVMDKTILEYIWLDGYKTNNLRSKVKAIVLPTNDIHLDDLPIWNFDGSSTKQAPGNNSECLLKPVRIYPWLNKNHYFILCEVMNPDGTPHESNTRSNLQALENTSDEEEYWWGFEQEYFMTKDYKIAGFPHAGYPQPQGYYYCGVGEGQVVGRKLSEDHLCTCIQMGIDLTGTNAEVAIGQWEYQCFGNNTLKACDDLWMSRYVLYRLGENYGLGVDLNPKPVHGDWNGSGCHTNFSTKWMREYGSYDQIVDLMNVFEEYHLSHIDDYGEGNHHRLTGLHETQHINTFSWGIGDRGASIRIPNAMKDNGWNGYIEDRRPASNCDPYLVAKNIIKSTQESKMI